MILLHPTSCGLTGGNFFYRTGQWGRHTALTFYTVFMMRAEYSLIGCVSVNVGASISEPGGLANHAR